ncbi:MAG: glycosyltransferase family 39 protein [Candidatus Dormibacteria bacterium]
MAVQLVGEAWGDSLTFDEARYIQTGTCALSTGTIDLEISNPPGHKLLAGAGVKLSGQPPAGSCADVAGFFPSEPGRLRRLILAARIPQMVLGVLLGLVVFLWSRALYGAVPGVLALAIVAFEPTLLGHAHLVTGDAAMSLGLVTCLAAHWAWGRGRRRRWLVVAGLALGWGLLTKPTILVVLPALVVVEMMAGSGSVRTRLRRALPSISVMAAVAWGLVCLVYMPFRQSHHDWSTPLAWIAPPSWFASLADAAHSARGAGHVNYLNGVITPAGEPFRWYFVEALALKTTIGLLALAVLAGILTIRRRDAAAAAYLWLPIGLVVTAATAGAVDVGVRYVLPAYPLMAVLAASAVMHARGVRRLQWAVVGIAAVSALVSSVAHFPRHLGYFNEAAGDRPEHYLSDSNIDWGQDAWRLRDWWEARGRPTLSLAYFGPLSLQHYGIAGSDVSAGTHAVRGLLVVSITRLTVTGDDTHFPYAGHPYLALQQRTPLDRVGTSMVVYDMDRLGRGVGGVLIVSCGAGAPCPPAGWRLLAGEARDWRGRHRGLP